MSNRKHVLMLATTWALFGLVFSLLNNFNLLETLAAMALAFLFSAGISFIVIKATGKPNNEKVPAPEPEEKNHS
ncbi:hypothetical protein [Salsuginibacillus kocurii]|uniref:hypothetical protein n=1 Tax=Salsuginibacillus kocurii TaxID=427078 RepID=UPI000375C71F|nr:hypothetical protein [Salsuginibacillus kocurii]